MDSSIPSFLLQNEQIKPIALRKKHRLGFVDKTIRNVASFVMLSFSHWHLSKKNGLLQHLDPRAKVIFLLSFVILASTLNTIHAQLSIFGVVILLHIISGVNLWNAYKKVAVISFFFGFLIFLPSALNVFNKGESVFTIVSFSKEYKWWIYNIPQEIAITQEGINAVLRLSLKVANSVSIVLLIVSTTTFEKIVRALLFFRVPTIFLLTLTLSYKFIFILSRTTEETYRALKMRWWNRGSVADAEEMVAGRIGYLFRKSWERYELVFQSMTARGFSGHVRFCYFEAFKLKDYLFLLGSFFILVSIIVLSYCYA